MWLPTLPAGTKWTPAPTMAAGPEAAPKPLQMCLALLGAHGNDVQKVLDAALPDPKSRLDALVDAVTSHASAVAEEGGGWLAIRWNTRSTQADFFYWLYAHAGLKVPMISAADFSKVVVAKGGPSDALPHLLSKGGGCSQLTTEMGFANLLSKATGGQRVLNVRTATAWLHVDVTDKFHAFFVAGNGVGDVAMQRTGAVVSCVKEESFSSGDEEEEEEDEDDDDVVIVGEERKSHVEPPAPPVDRAYLDAAMGDARDAIINAVRAEVAAAMAEEKKKNGKRRREEEEEDGGNGGNGVRKRNRVWTAVRCTAKLVSVAACKAATTVAVLRALVGLVGLDIGSNACPRVFPALQ